MKGVIMAGGFGTRLRPITCNIPKPMVPVVNFPIMHHIVNLLKKHNIKDMVSILYYQPEIIMDYFKDGKHLGIKMDYTRAEEDYGTAGSVKFSQPKIGNEPFLVISGDVMTDFDLTEAIKFHKKKKAKVTIVLTRVPDPLAFGVVITDKNGVITRFLEKPSWGEVFSDTVNTGIYIIEPEILDFIPPETNFDFSQNLFPLLIEKGIKIYGYIADGYWKDVGNIKEYLNVHMDILNGEMNIDIPLPKINTIGKDVWVGEGTEGINLRNFKGGVVIGKNCQIDKSVKIKNSIIGNNCVIGKNVKIEDTIIWDNSVIGEGVSLNKNIIGKEVKIGDRAFLGEYAIVCDGCRVGSHSVLKPNVKMWPFKVLEDGATLASSLIWGDKWERNLFGTLGVSGIGNVEITPEFASKLGAAFGAYLGKGSYVATSRDPHKTSRLLNRAIISGLLSAGVNVHDLRATPIPVTRYQMSSAGDIAAIHTRRSPRDPNMIEIRFFDSDGSPLPTKKEKSVERLFFREDFPRANIEETGELTFPHRTIEYYQEGLLRHTNLELVREANFKIVVDYANSPAASIFPSILGKFNCETIALNAYVDDKNLTKTEDEFNSSLQQLAQVTTSLGADFGIMFDTGAERIFLVDEKGHIIPNITATALLSMLVMKHFVKNEKDAMIAVPVNVPNIFEKMAEKYKSKIFRTQTNAKSFSRVIRENKNIIFLSDGRGGYSFVKMHPFFDSMYATAKIMELLALEKEPLSKLVKKVPAFHQIETQIHCPWEKKGFLMRKLMEYSARKKRELIDGVRIKVGKNEYVLLIPDPDYPYFKIFAESTSDDKAQKLAQEYVELLNKWLDE